MLMIIHVILISAIYSVINCRLILHTSEGRAKSAFTDRVLLVVGSPLVHPADTFAFVENGRVPLRACNSSGGTATRQRTR